MNIKTRVDFSPLRLGLAMTMMVLPAVAQANPFASPIIRVLSGVQPLPLELPSGTNAHTEIPPVLLPAPDGARLIYLPTGYVYQCQTTGNPLNEEVQLLASQCAVVDLPEDNSAPNVFKPPGPGDIPTGRNQWELNYDAVFSAHITKDTITGKQIIVTVNHGETKNYLASNGYRYQSPFAPRAASLPPDCGYQGYMGAGPRGFRNCWLSYAAFVSVEQNDYSAATHFGQTLNRSVSGPVIWPTNGYYDLSRGNEGMLSVGLRHPSSIIFGGYIYVYYFDTSKGSIGGLSAMGTKLARAQINAHGLPDAFYAWNGADFETPALPAGFDKDNLARFIATPGPRIPALFSREAVGRPDYPLQSTHFSVAYSKKRQAFVGVENFIEYVGGNEMHKVAIRLSTDLVHWGPRNLLPIDGHDLSYATFANANFTSNSEVDFRNIYLLGTSHGRVNFLRISIE